MRTFWLLAKYTEDLRRREPINIGVVLVSQNGLKCRFMGQRSDGEIDGRTVRCVGSVGNFKSWVRYWQHSLEETFEIHGWNPEAYLSLTSPSCGANYALEFGGERILGLSAPEELGFDHDDLLEDLYVQLVDAAPDRTNLSVERLSESVLKQAGIESKVMRRWGLGLKQANSTQDRVFFDYRYDNGRTHLMQRVALTYEDTRSWDSTHVAAWSFMQVRENWKRRNLQGAMIVAEGPPVIQTEEPNLIALVKMRESDPDLPEQLNLLKEQNAIIIDVRNEERAGQRLAELVGSQV